MLSLRDERERRSGEEERGKREEGEERDEDGRTLPPASTRLRGYQEIGSELRCVGIRQRGVSLSLVMKERSEMRGRKAGAAKAAPVSCQQPLSNVGDIQSILKAQPRSKVKCRKSRDDSKLFCLEVTPFFRPLALATLPCSRSLNIHQTAPQ